MWILDIKSGRWRKVSSDECMASLTAWVNHIKLIPLLIYYRQYNQQLNRRSHTNFQQSCPVNTSPQFPQLTLPKNAQPRALHTATELNMGPGQTHVPMFGGCPKWELGKPDATLQKLAKTTVLEFGEPNTYIAPSVCLPFTFCIEYSRGFF